MPDFSCFNATIIIAAFLSVFNQIWSRVNVNVLELFLFFFASITHRPCAHFCSIYFCSSAASASISSCLSMPSMWAEYTTRSDEMNFFSLDSSM